MEAGTEPLEGLRRALDVTKEERDRPRGKSAQSREVIKHTPPGENS